MQGSERTKVGPALIVLAVAGGLGACNTASPVLTTGSIPDRKPPMVVSDAERDCLGRAMYFESNRSDSDGLVAVGTVVMNRLENAVFPGASARLSASRDSSRRACSPSRCRRRTC